MTDDLIDPLDAADVPRPSPGPEDFDAIDLAVVEANAGKCPCWRDESKGLGTVRVWCENDAAGDGGGCDRCQLECATPGPMTEWGKGI